MHTIWFGSEEEEVGSLPMTPYILRVLGDGVEGLSICTPAHKKICKASFAETLRAFYTTRNSSEDNNIETSPVSVRNAA